MDVMKKHYETLTILGGMAVILVGCCMWINGKFSEVNTRLTKIETVLILRGIMPAEMAVAQREED